ncbi:deoxyribose-phosphate aldolase [Ignavigranum ruoffiae]|uniref:deoxyribose-phosphate aldolase n=1 Tax=Ignavigranum ruoffiae TaxID=89093 RepID=UPI0024ACBCDE|nr:deoxyribose-phosphate aldolase [Ignavigranum ruoffiae]
MKLNKYIDHTLLKADAQESQITQLCQEAKQYNFMSVCVNPCWVSLASELLKDSEVKVCTVIGFPLGANTTAVKVFEASQAVKEGAEEVDMVINIAWLKDQHEDQVQKEIEAVVQAVPADVIVKVIIETSLLTAEEIQKVSKIVTASGADFIKTSTGFSTAGARVEDIQLMRQAGGPDIGIKASGGVSNREQAEAMIQAGATRIGASKGIEIVKAP